MVKKNVKRDFNYIWEIIEVPVVIVIVYSLLELFFSVNSYIDKLFPSQIFSWILTIFAFGLIGYNASREESNESARYGAYAGLITGFAGAIIGIITFYYYPEKIADALAKAAQAGADMSMVQTFMKIGLYASLVLSPIINAAIGGFIAWISGMIFKKKK